MSRRPGFELKTPKGTRDWVGSDLAWREDIFQTISSVFKRHGGTPLDTPVFELKEVLAEKYGEDAHLVYDLADQGGEICSLRFDLTVPFARWLAMKKITHVKRYQIAKVYRRDQPAISRGRLREFHQCDFDIAGLYDPMIADAEILSIIAEVFEALDLKITIKINHRQILDGLFAVAGVPDEKMRSISSALDKMDKMSWSEVKREMVQEKGLLEEVADRIGDYVRRSGDIYEVLQFLESNPGFSANENMKAGLHDMRLLVSYLEALDVVNKVSFDLSLARGLDYYSGLIFEIITKPPSGNVAVVSGEGIQSSEQRKPEPSQVGSIAAGGRYDSLVGMYGKRPIPCVGVSFGVDRICTVLEERREKAQKPKIDVYIMAFSGKDSNGFLLERMMVARQLWDAGIRAEFAAKVKPNLPQQFKAAKDLPLAVIFGQDELSAGQVRLKVLLPDNDENDTKDRGQLVSREDLVEEVKKLLKITISN
ncbi:Class II aaRS and biotin synthetase [Glarea lozoyensis ATCC 20868]|uniref:histidine--tRNA ligase n=1 Tax=Glarea lozoyensis (strain ATCC 20868 / MF5171) TaxID=1116229 RepID=S3DFQ4_GLAL2|nr:Class II aaRS and biotin synthetase [Glarea lozoyensis ATCC 20868]EPE35974.1 Class II aaRS and biotin synthetase [Glarea lozoyensis ATCC 20868]